MIREREWLARRLDARAWPVVDAAHVRCAWCGSFLKSGAKAFGVRLLQVHEGCREEFRALAETETQAS